MKIYIALLRGINVSGHKQVRMDQLRALFNNLGFKNVQTYIQSGNVIFHSASSSIAEMTKKIQTAMVKSFGFSAPVLILPAATLKKVIQKNSFLKEKNIDATKLHVTFLSAAPAKANLEKLATIKAGDDKFRSVDDLIYLHCPNGYGNTKLSNTTIEKALAVEATTRNWKTINELYRLCEA